MARRNAMPINETSKSEKKMPGNFMLDNVEGRKISVIIAKA